MSDEGPAESTSPQNKGDRPKKFLETWQGWIVALTGVVVALGGLLTAFQNLIPKPEAAPPTSSNLGVSTPAIRPVPTESVAKETVTATPVASTTVQSSPTVAQPEWVFQSTELVDTFRTPQLHYPGGWPEFTRMSPPVGENLQLRNPQWTFEKDGGSDFSNFVDHRVGYPVIQVAPDGRHVIITYRSCGDAFTVHLWADVYKRGTSK